MAKQRGHNGENAQGEHHRKHGQAHPRGDGLGQWAEADRWYREAEVERKEQAGAVLPR